MKFIQLSASLKNEIDKAYLLTGDDAYLKQSAIKLISNACGTELLDFNLSVFDNENWDINRFCESVNSMPIANLKKIVICKNLDKLNEKDKAKMQAEINNLPETTCLILDVNKNFNGCISVDCSVLDNITLSKFIINDLAKNGKKISSDALNLLIEFCSHNLTKIVSELPKLVSYSTSEVVSSDVVKLLVAPDEEFQVFELSEALGLKNKNKTIKLISLLLEKKDYSILGLITNHFRRIIFCGLSDYTNEELADMLKVKPFAVLKARNQSKLYSKIQLKKILELLEELDFMIKSGKMQYENAIYYLVFNILYI